MSFADNLVAAYAAMAQQRGRRLFGADNIKRYLQQQKRDHLRRASTSIATGNRHGGAHLHEREIARRLGQQKVMSL